MSECEYLILGGGLAGMSLAHALALRQPGREIVLLEAGEPWSEASSAPQAMMHPLPGLSLAPKPGYLDAFGWTQAWLQSWNDLSPDSLLWKTSLLRPLWPNDSASERLLRSFQTHQHAYSGRVEGELLSSEQTSSWHTHQAIRLSPAYGVSMPLLGQVMKRHIGEAEVFSGVRVDEIRRVGKKWEVSGPSGRWLTRSLLLAVGSGLTRWFPSLPIVLTGGELVDIRSLPVELDAMVSYRGHIVPWPGKRWTLGATYWDMEHSCGEDWFSWSRASRESKPAWPGLMERMAGYFPWLNECKVERVWQSCRTVVHPDRQPLVGPVPGQENCYVLGALASKGLLLGAWLAEQLVKYLVSEEPLPKWASTARIDKVQWTLKEKRECQQELYW